MSLPFTSVIYNVEYDSISFGLRDLKVQPFFNSVCGKG